MSTTKMRHAGVAAALSVFLSVAATASFAQTVTSENPMARNRELRAPAHRDLGNARAQAIRGRIDPRQQAIQECAEAEQKYSQPTWGNLEYYAYRSCMASHGQPE